MSVRTSKSEKIKIIYCIIICHTINISSPFFFDGIALGPSAELWAVVAVVVVDEAGFVVSILAAETERVLVSVRRILQCAEGGVGVGRYISA